MCLGGFFMARRVAMDRRLWLLALTVISVVIVSRWILPPAQAFRAFTFAGYWFVLGAVVLFGRALVATAGATWSRFCLRRIDRVAVAAILLSTAVWWAHEKPGFKILADEVLLLGTSMGMHYERLAAFPTRATDVQGPFQILERALDKRPLLFPFLTASVHDLTGYRPENPFYLNRILGVVFLVLVYLVGWKASGRRWGGITAILLFGGLPLLAQQSAGSGFELLNLVMIAAVSLLMLHYLQRPDEPRLEAMIYGGLLLASTRYESVVFLGPVAVAAVLGWLRCDRVIISWPAILSPVFLAPLLMQNRYFSDGSAVWQLAGRPGMESPFGWEYIVPNLGHALAFFFDFSSYQPSSSFFALLGLVAVPFFILWSVRLFRQPLRQDAAPLAFALAGAGLAAVVAVHLLYFWGQYDDPIISRLSLPLHLLMALSICVVGPQFIRSDFGWKMLSLVAGGAFLLQGLPLMAKHAYEQHYPPGVEMAFRREFLDQQREKNFLFIDNDSVFWITHKIPATPASLAPQRKEALAFHLRNHSFSEMYVFQSVLVDATTSERLIDPEDDLGLDFDLEIVRERRINALLFARISRVTAIHEGGEVVARAVDAVAPAGELRTAEELDAASTSYLENWIKMLP